MKEEYSGNAVKHFEQSLINDNRVFYVRPSKRDDGDGVKSFESGERESRGRGHLRISISFLDRIHVYERVLFRVRGNYHHTGALRARARAAAVVFFRVAKITVFTEGI